MNVAIVVPILNEAESLPQLLEAIRLQTARPRELIFVDAGSTDGSPDLIRSWWQAHGWENCICDVLSLPGGMPGGGRNAGICAATSDWIAFLDGGIEPEPDWLQHLTLYVVQHQAQGVFGVCRFEAEAPFERAVCALSYGYESIHPVIPASLFHREVFERIGLFPDNLRAAEDLVWVGRYLRHYGTRLVCKTAMVHYRHFPTTWTAAIRKWHINEIYSVMAGVRARQHLLYLTAFPVLYTTTFMYPVVGVPMFAAYLCVRGIIDPIRRSKKRLWWGKYPLALLQAIGLAVLLDLAKLAGICRQQIKKSLS